MTTPSGQQPSPAAGTAEAGDDARQSGVLIINPYSSGMTAKRERAIVEILRERMDVDVLHTQRPNHAQELAAGAVASKVDVVVACGGDGTANEVINGMDLSADTADRRPALAIIPGGATNVLARGLGLPNHPVKAARHLAQAIEQRTSSPITLGKVDERLFLFAAGVGVDGETVKHKETSRAGRRSSDLAYFTSIVGQFMGQGMSLKERMTISIDGAEEFRSAAAMCCNIDPYTYLGKIPVNLMPAAQPNNGLSIVAPERLGGLFALSEGGKAIVSGRSRKKFSAKRQGYDNVSRVEVTCDDPQPVQADGEYLGDSTHVVVSAVYNTVRLVY